MSERVESFRKRRGRLQPDTDPAENLDLDFEGPAKPQDNRSLDDALGTEDRDSGFDLEIGEFAASRGKDRPSPETVSLEGSDDQMMQIDAAPVEVEEMALGEPLAKSPPMEILVGSPIETAPEEDEREEGIFVAPLGRRFLAGLTDALVLILGAAVFGMIFWRFCGRLSIVPLNIAVLGFIAVILIFAYFGLFTAIASATPGLLWMGCEIRNLRGGPPTVSESFWRAFGVLVSLAALMLGFVWACVDSDSLTWHDRMSGTVITDERNAADLAVLKAET
ncbi:MAG TPA: RDD family protein [Terriglobia bacterium]|nr:RDD family protein [Terriglobia bacterium]